MLTGQNFGRCHYGCLAAAFHSIEHGHQRNNGLARTNIALQKAQHPAFTGHIVIDIGQCTLLCACHGKGQVRGKLLSQITRTIGHAPTKLAHFCPDQRQGQLIGEQFVIGKPLAGRMIRR